MAKHVLKLILVLGTGLSMAACGGYGSMVDVLRGNLEYSRGEYQAALVHYMVAIEDKEDDAWTRFNIGNVYYALGEHDAALEVWHNARNVVEADEGAGNAGLSLIFATSYNRGVLLYQQGRYQAAYDEFCYALEVNSRSTEAKANCELAWQKLQASEAAESEMQEGAGGLMPTPPDASAETDPDEQTLRILEYVRRKESQQWFANRDIESQEDAEDW